MAVAYPDSLAEKINGYKRLKYIATSLDDEYDAISSVSDEYIREARSTLREAIWRRLPELRKELIEDMKNYLAETALNDALKCDGIAGGV